MRLFTKKSVFLGALVCAGALVVGVPLVLWSFNLVASAQRYLETLNIERVIISGTRIPCHGLTVGVAFTFRKGHIEDEHYGLLCRKLFSDKWTMYEKIGDYVRR